MELSIDDKKILAFGDLWLLKWIEDEKKTIQLIIKSEAIIWSLGSSLYSKLVDFKMIPTWKLVPIDVRQELEAMARQYEGGMETSKTFEISKILFVFNSLAELRLKK